MGGSYGGFMTMWANTQTHRFKAIVAGAGIAELDQLLRHRTASTSG